MDDLQRGRAFLGSTQLLGSSHKIDLSNGFGGGQWLTAVMYLPPSDSSGRWNLCPWATPGCRAVCLGIASGRMNHGAEATETRSFNWEKTTVAMAQMKRATLFMEDRSAFKAVLIDEIQRLLRKAERKGVKLAIRLDGASDVPWEKAFPGLMESFGTVQFYDYTKAPLIARNAAANYHLTYSLGETPDSRKNADEWLAAGRNVAVVFGVDKHHLPTTWQGREAINGDLHDMRFLDGAGQYVALSAKGGAKRDTTGFVIREGV